MNRLMWSHDRLAPNVSLLASRGIMVLGPGEGDQACGEPARAACSSPTRLWRRSWPARGWLARRRKLIVTAAPPVSDRSGPVHHQPQLGKMGFAVAEAARDAGATVVLSRPGQRVHAAGRDALDVENGRSDACRGQPALPGTESSSPPRPCPTTGGAGTTEKIKKTSASLSSRSPHHRHTREGGWAHAALRRGVRGRDPDTSNAMRSPSSRARPDMIAANQSAMPAFDQERQCAHGVLAGGKRERHVPQAADRRGTDRADAAHYAARSTAVANGPGGRPAVQRRGALTQCGRRKSANPRPAPPAGGCSMRASVANSRSRSTRRTARHARPPALHRQALTLAPARRNSCRPYRDPLADRPGRGVLPRSGPFTNRNRDGNLVGLIDSITRAGDGSCWNRSGSHYTIAPVADRPMVIVPIVQVALDVVESFAGTARGAGGFGSSGTS